MNRPAIRCSDRGPILISGDDQPQRCAPTLGHSGARLTAPLPSVGQRFDSSYHWHPARSSSPRNSGLLAISYALDPRAEAHESSRVPLDRQCCHSQLQCHRSGRCTDHRRATPAIESIPCSRGTPRPQPGVTSSIDWRSSKSTNSSDDRWAPVETPRPADFT